MVVGGGVIRAEPHRDHGQASHGRKGVGDLETERANIEVQRTAAQEI